MGMQEMSFVIGWIFAIIGAIVVFKLCRVLHFLARDSAYHDGAIVPLKYGIAVFAVIFLLIKIFGYELDMGIAVIYFALMLAVLIGIIHGWLLAQRKGGEQEWLEEYQPKA